MDMPQWPKWKSQLFIGSDVEGDWVHRIKWPQVDKGKFKSFLTVSQDLKVNLCGLQQDNVVTVMVRIIMMMWESPGDSNAIAIQWVHMVKDPLVTILLVHTVTSKYTFCYQ